MADTPYTNTYQTIGALQNTGPHGQTHPGYAPGAPSGLPPHGPSVTHNSHSGGSSSAGGPSATGPSGSVDDLARIFNTAIIATRLKNAADTTKELSAMMDSPAFRAILNAVRQLTVSEGLTPREAAEPLIETFRKLDRTWGDYLLQEGVSHLRGT